MKFLSNKLTVYCFLAFLLAIMGCSEDNPLPPNLEVQPLELDFEKDAKISSLTFLVKNTGEQGMNWTVNKSVEWLDFRPSTGTLQGRGQKRITIIIDRSMLEPGENTATIQVEAKTHGGESISGEGNITIKASSNQSPTNIILSKNTIAENRSKGTVVGNFRTEDPDSDDKHTYVLISGTGDADNNSFSVKDNSLRTSAAFNFEDKSTYSIRVRTTDQDGEAFEKTFTIQITDRDEVPTNITINRDTIAENKVVGSIVGNFSTADPNNGDRHTYKLVSGDGDVDNSKFSIQNNRLRAMEKFDFEDKPTHSIRVRTTDAAGHFFEKKITIKIVDKNEPPTDITIDNNIINENEPIGTTVGILSAVDPDMTEDHTYILRPNRNYLDNRNFRIVNNELRTTIHFNYEARDSDYMRKTSYSVRIRAIDKADTFYTRNLTINVGDDANDNQIPSSIMLSKNNIDENQATGTTIAMLSTNDADVSDTHSYTLVMDPSGIDNDSASFTIIGDELKSNEIFDYETKNIFNIRVRVTDAKLIPPTPDTGGDYYEENFIITINDLVDWNQKTSNADWSTRNSHTSVVFNNKMWIIGGVQQDVKNDVWYSDDGSNWTEAISSAGWTPRLDHTSVVFDGRIWVIGGWDGISDNNKNDVWHSNDGSNWIEATNSASWTPRYGHSSVVFNDGSGDKIWILGGYDNTNSYKNDVWYSDDGSNWTEASRSSAGWDIRYGHSSVVFDGKIWVIGGKYDINSYREDVWYSTDGMTWIEVTSTPEWAISTTSSIKNPNFVVFDGMIGGVSSNRIWAIGGEDGSDSHKNNVWYSEDGITWTEELFSATPPSTSIFNIWSPRSSHTSVVFDGTIWVIGGDDGTNRNDVWFLR